MRLRRVLPHRFKKKAFIVVLLLLANSLLELAGLGVLIPLFIAILQPEAFQQGFLQKAFEFSGFESTNSFVFLLSAFIFIFVLIKNLITLWIVRYQSRFSFGLYGYFATRMQRLFYQKGFLFFKSKNSNEIVRDINAVPSLFAQSFLLSFLSLLTEAAILLFIVLGITIYNVNIIVLLTAIVLPVFLVFYRLVKRKIADLAIEANQLNAITGRNLFQSIFGYVDVMINNNKDWFFKQYQKNVKRLAEIRSKQYVFNTMPTKVIETTMILGIIMIIGYGIVYLPSRKDLLVLLAVFALAAYKILPSINRMMVAVMNIRSYQFTLNVIESVKELKEETEIFDLLEFNREIKIKDLSYRYPGKTHDVLHGINFTVQKGQSIGFVGRSGSGKTTLINILLGFLNATKGQVLVDGVELNKSNVLSWRHLVGYVQQEVFLIDGTLAENIALGYGEIDRNRVADVAKRASLIDLIDELPQGIDSRVGERGARLSGGQKQRVGIARALYSGAQILFFDEATSSLDSETENEITEAINHLSGDNLTMFIIAHRVSTLRYCDRIFELKKGFIQAKALDKMI